MIGAKEGAISARSIRPVEAKRYDREVINSMIGVLWDQGTAIGRPKRKHATPQVVPTEAADETQSNSRDRGASGD